MASVFHIRRSRFYRARHLLKQKQSWQAAASSASSMGGTELSFRVDPKKPPDTIANYADVLVVSSFEAPFSSTDSRKAIPNQLAHCSERSSVA